MSTGTYRQALANENAYRKILAASFLASGANRKQVQYARFAFSPTEPCILELASRRISDFVNNHFFQTEIGKLHPETVKTNTSDMIQNSYFC